MPEDINTQIDTLTDPANTESTTGGSNNSTFMSEVQNRLLGQADVISSTDTALESTFNKAISGVRSSQQASEARIESEFGRQSGYLQDNAQDRFTDFAETRSGFGTQMVAFRRLVETTDKELKDLEQRKQELILQGESNAATQIAQLQVQQLQFRQQAQQNVFSNLLGLGQFAQQNRQQDLAEKQFGLQTKQFQLQGIEVAMAATTQAFERIGQLKQLGALGTLSEEQRTELEKNAGLPAGVVQEIANVAADREIRAVGDTLLAINPKTLETTVLYNAPAKSSGGDGEVSLGDSSVSWLTASVMNGMQSLDSLTPTQQAKVRSEMAAVGFGSSEPPQWFVDRMRQGLIDKMSPGGTTSEENLSSAAKATADANWGKYQESFVYGPRFLDEQFIGRIYSDAVLEANEVEDPVAYRNDIQQRINAWRDAGYSDREIASVMGLD